MNAHLFVWNGRIADPVPAKRDAQAKAAEPEPDEPAVEDPEAELESPARAGLSLAGL